MMLEWQKKTTGENNFTHHLLNLMSAPYPPATSTRLLIEGRSQPKLDHVLRLGFHDEPSDI